MRAAKHRGFTLIELSVVVLVMLVISALIAPNLTQMGAGIKARSFLSALPRIASQARETAIEHAGTTKLTYDDAQKAIVLTEEKTDQDDTTITSISLPKGVEVADFQLKGQSSNAGDWELRFYSDGQSDGGGIQVDDNRRPWSLTVDKYGIGKLQQATLPSESQTRWPSGDYEHRQ